MLHLMLRTSQHHRTLNLQVIKAVYLNLLIHRSSRLGRSVTRGKEGKLIELFQHGQHLALISTISLTTILHRLRMCKMEIMSPTSLSLSSLGYDYDVYDETLSVQSLTHRRHIFKCPFFLTFMPLPYMHTIARYYILRALLMNYFIILQMKKKKKQSSERFWDLTPKPLVLTPLWNGAFNIFNSV